MSGDLGKAAPVGRVVPMNAEQIAGIRGIRVNPGKGVAVAVGKRTGVGQLGQFRQENIVFPKPGDRAVVIGPVHDFTFQPDEHDGISYLAFR